MKPDQKSPSSSPSPSLSADPGASSEASSTGSGNGLAGALGFGDAGGPAFDPDAGGPGPLVEEPADDGIQWDPTVVKGVLTAQGLALHGLVAVDPDSDEWIHTANDLQAIAPPLCRILNRYDVTRAAAGTGDELALMVAITGYVTRSYRTRRESLAELAGEEVGPQPVTGIVPDPITPAHQEAARWTTES